MEAVGIGDLHLDKLDNIIPGVSNMITRSVARVFNWALDRGITNVFLYGDIGEHARLSYDAQVALYTLFGKRRYKDLNIYIILGNHDFSEDGTHSLQVLEAVCKWTGNTNIRVFTKAEVVDVDGVPVHFMPYPVTKTIKTALNVGHFEVAGSLRDNGRKIDEGHESKHVTLMGHLHTNHKVRNTYFSGTLNQKNFGESMPKYFHHIRLKEGAPILEAEIESVKFKPEWQLLNTTVSTLRDLEDLEKDERTFYKLYLKDGLDIDINQVLLDYPNVIRHNTFKNKKDLETLVHREWELDNELVSSIVDFDEHEVISEFLAKAGHSKKQIARGHEILRSVKPK